MAAVTIAATTTTLTAFQTGGTVWLVIMANADFVTAAGQPVLKGNPSLPGIGNHFYKKVALTVDGSGVVSIPAIDIESTEDSSNPYVTLQAYILDANLNLLQSFLYSFRVPVSPASTTWELLMVNMTVPQIIINPGVARTDGVLQEYDTANGLIDSIAAHVGSNIEISGGLLVSGNIAAAIISASGALNGASGSITNDWNIGRDLLATRHGVFGGNVTAANFIGNGSALTGIGSGTGGVINPGSTTIGADSDADGSGVIDLQTRNLTRLRVNNTGLVEAFYGLQGALIDKGGEKFNVKAYGALGDGATDDTAAINAALAAAALAHGGIVYFPPGEYMTTGGHVLVGGITIEGCGGPPPNPHAGIDTDVCVIHLTVDNAAVFEINENTFGIHIRKLSAVSDFDGATQFILAQGDNAVGGSRFHKFEFLWPVNFTDVIKVVPATPGASWQFDLVTVAHCTLVGRLSGLHIDSPDTDQWLVTNCQLGALQGATSYGVKAIRSGTMTFDTCYSAGNAPVNSRAMFYITPQRDQWVIKNCWCEPHDYFIEGQDSANTNAAIPLVLIGNGVVPCYFGHAVYLASFGNTYYGEGIVTLGALAGDMVVESYADSVIAGAGSPTVPLEGSPFDMTIASNPVGRITRFSVFENILHTDLKVQGHVGAGLAVPHADAILSMELSTTERSNSTPFIEMLSGNGNDYTLARDDATGRLFLRGTQGGGVVGLNINGHIEPSADNQFVCGHDTARWSLVRAVVVTQGDSVFSDRETGEPLFVVNEDREGLYFNLAEVVDGETRAGKRLGWFDRSGNWHVTGKIIEHG